MWLPRRLKCSFCGRGEDAVAKLVAGRRAYICDRCVAAAARIMDDHPPGSPAAAAAGGRRRWTTLELLGRPLRRASPV